MSRLGSIQVTQWRFVVTNMHQGVNAKLAQLCYCSCWFCFVLHAQPGTVGVSSLAVERFLMFLLLPFAAVCIRYSVCVCVHPSEAEDEDEENDDEDDDTEEAPAEKKTDGSRRFLSGQAQ